MRRPALAVIACCLPLAAAAPAHGASTFTIDGAGFGHGIGMSQYGAMGYAQHGFGYREILGHYYTGTSLGHAPSGEVVRVLLQSPRAARFTGADRAGTRSLSPGKTYGVTSTLGGTVVLRSPSGRRLATFNAPLQVTGPGPLRLLGGAANGVTDGLYRGWLEFRPNALGGVLAINALGLEQYVAGVVSAESPASWPMAALQAQAVAARTYAITTNAGSSQGFDQFADTRSQMYKGVAAEGPSTNSAVNSTRGEVVTYGGRPAVTYFFSTSGGRTENIEDSFVGAEPQPWLKSVPDPYDNVSPWHRWKTSMSMKQAARALGGLVKGTFRGIEVTRRGNSPRVVRAVVVGSDGRTPVTGPTLRARLGLRDTWAYFVAISSHKENPDNSPGGTSPSARAAAATGGVLAGRVVPVRPGAQVRVQELVGRRWQLAAVTLAGRGGVYRTTVPGPGLYRVVAHGATGPAVRIGR